MENSTAFLIGSRFAKAGVAAAAAANVRKVRRCMIALFVPQLCAESHLWRQTTYISMYGIGGTLPNMREYTLNAPR
jgi:hypothetical protein